MLSLLCTTTMTAAAILDPPPSLNWTNVHGGPIVERGDPIQRLQTAAAPSAPVAASTSSPLRAPCAAYNFSYTMYTGYLDAGNDLELIQVTSSRAALDASLRPHPHARLSPSSGWREVERDDAGVARHGHLGGRRARSA